MKYLLLLIILSFIPYSLKAFQVAEGRVVHSESKESIPFVNIGIIKNGTGTVSDEQGFFSVKYLKKTDIITFSAIGFQPLEMTIAHLKENSVAEMIPVIYELDEVSVDTRGYEKPRDLGYNFSKRGHSIGFGSTSLGTEIGGLIEIDRETVIYSAYFAVNHINREPLLLRVNLYEFQDGKPGKNLIPENVIISSPDEPGLIHVDLTEYNIRTESDVLLSLEWVKGVVVDEEQGTQGITFRAKKVRRNANTWFRSTSLAPYSDFTEFIKLQIGFYLRAQQVKK